MDALLWFDCLMYINSYFYFMFTIANFAIWTAKNTVPDGEFNTPNIKEDAYAAATLSISELLKLLLFRRYRNKYQGFSIAMAVCFTSLSLVAVLYCVEFEILKASKACRKEQNFKALKEGERICVKCESEALRKNLGWRCQGHGVEGRTTRWSALSAPHCHGKWLRAQAEPDHECLAKTCQSENAFIFV